jgi:hypothetical protein
MCIHAAAGRNWDDVKSSIRVCRWPSTSVESAVKGDLGLVANKAAE